MSEKLEVAMEMLEEATEGVDDIDVIFNIRNAQQLLLYELEDRQGPPKPEPEQRCRHS